MKRFQWLRRYQFPISLAGVSGAAFRYGAQSVLLGVVVFVVALGLFVLWYGLPGLISVFLEQSELLERSARLNALHRRSRGWLKIISAVLICVLFTGLGAVLAIVGHGSDRLIGIGSVLFFGPASLAVIVTVSLDWLTSRGARTSGNDSHTSVRTVRHHGQPRQALVFDLAPNRVELGLATLVFASWTGACLLFGFVDSRQLVRLVLVIPTVLTSLLTLVGLVQLLGGSSSITLHVAGIRVRWSYGSLFVPWDVIDAATLFEYGTYGWDRIMLGIVVTDRSLIERSWILRHLGRANRTSTGYDIACWVTPGQRTTQIEWTIRYFLDNPGERSQLDRLGETDDLYTASDNQFR